MEVEVYGKKKCGLCDAAKQKLDIMKIPYSFVDLDVVLEYHEGWRDNGNIHRLSLLSLNNARIPTIVIDGVPYEYSKAMAELKRARKSG